MLWETFHYCTTPCPLRARRMGFLSESISTGSRGYRCRKAWATHLEHTRDFIINTASRCPGQDSAIIFGSGWLFDIPLEHLARTFNSVILADVIHPWHTRLKTFSHSNVRLLTCDASGGLLSQAYDKIPPQKWNLSLTHDLPKTSLAISANILSQLPILPLEWLEKHRIITNENDWESASHLIQSQHLRLLRSIAPHRCIITDFRENPLNASPQALLSPQLFKELPPSETWEWNIKPPGEATAPTTHSVMALNETQEPDSSTSGKTQDFQPNPSQ